MHAEAKAQEKLSLAWAFAARFPCLIYISILIILPAVSIPAIFLTSAKDITLETDFEDYLTSSEPASQEYETLANLLADYSYPVATSSPTSAPSRNRRALSSSSVTEYLELIYYCGSDCTSIFTEAKIEAIHTFETKFKSSIYSSYCPIDSDTSECVTPDSLLNFFYPTVDGSTITFDGEGSEMISISSALQYIEETSDTSDLWYFPRSFVEDGANISLARSEYRLVFDSDDAMTAMVKETLLPFLNEHLELGANVRLMWYNSDINSIEVYVLILNDMRFAAVSLAFVLACMFFHSRSVFLSITAVYSIAMSFPLTYVIYTLAIGNEVMMIFNFTSVFVLVGIGADDFAIFVDIWGQSRELPGFTLGDRLRWTWRRAAGATLVTSVTTAASFLANLASPINPIQEFGQFMGVLVIVNYVFIIMLLPPALVIHDRYFYHLYDCCTIPIGKRIEKRRQEKAQGKAAAAAAETNAATETEARPGSSHVEGESDERTHVEGLPASGASFQFTRGSSLHETRSFPFAQETSNLSIDSEPVLSEEVPVARVGSNHYPSAPPAEEFVHSPTSVNSVNLDVPYATETSEEEVLRNQQQAEAENVERQPYLVRFFYVYIAPFVYKRRYFLAAGFIVLTAILASFMGTRVAISDSLPDIFGNNTNLGLLLQIRSEYFSDTTISSSSGSSSGSTVTACVDSSGSLATCTPSPTSEPTTLIPTSRPTTQNPTSRPTSEPTGQPTAAPVSTPAPTLKPTGQPTSPTVRPTTLSPTSRPTQAPTLQPTSIVLPSSLPSMVLIVNGTTLISHYGTDGPTNGYIYSTADANAISTTLCTSSLSGSSSNSVFAVEDGSVGDCTLDQKLENVVNQFSATEVLIAIHQSSSENSTSSNSRYATTIDETNLASIVSATSLAFGPPLVVTYSSSDSRRQLQFTGGGSNNNNNNFGIGSTTNQVNPTSAPTSSPTSQTSSEILSTLSPTLIFTDSSGVTSVVIPSFSTSAAESLADELQSASDVTAVEVSDSVAQVTLAPSAAPTSYPTTTAPTTASPTIAPTTARPTMEPTYPPTDAPSQQPTISPTLAPSQAPTLAPTLSPTGAPTITCECSGHGDCASDATVSNPVCECYSGWEGDYCNTTDPSVTELSDDEVADVDITWWSSVLDDMTLTQERMITMCDTMEAEANSTDNPLEVRRVSTCFMPNFQAYVEDDLGLDFPITDLATYTSTLRHWVMYTSEGYAARYYALFTDAGELEVVRMTVLTNYNEYLAASLADTPYNNWEKFVSNVDSSAWQTSWLWARTQTELAIIRGTLWSTLISLAFCFGAVFIFSRFSIIVAIMSTLSIVVILAIFLSILVVFMDRSFGAIEALGVIILAGLSVDYSLHLAHSFHEAKQYPLAERVRQALGQTGPSVLFGAITTAGAACILMICTIQLFKDFGMMIAVNTALSLVVSIYFLIPLLVMSYAAVNTVRRKICGRKEPETSSEKPAHPAQESRSHASSSVDSETLGRSANSA